MTLSPYLSSHGPRAPSDDQLQYCLVFNHSGRGGASIELIEADTASVVAAWTGLLAWHLLNVCNAGDACRAFPLSRSGAWNLVLTVAAIRRYLLRAGLDDATTAAAIARQPLALPTLGQSMVRDSSDRLSRDARVNNIYAVAGMLLANPGCHLTADDVEQLLLANIPVIPEGTVAAGLRALTRLGFVQRIEVTVDHVFYDTDITPHAHVFDAAKSELRDASSRSAHRLAQRCGQSLVSMC